MLAIIVARHNACRRVLHKDAIRPRRCRVERPGRIHRSRRRIRHPIILEQNVRAGTDADAAVAQRSVLTKDNQPVGTCHVVVHQAEIVSSDLLAVAKATWQVLLALCLGIRAAAGVVRATLSTLVPGADTVQKRQPNILRLKVRSPPLHALRPRVHRTRDDVLLRKAVKLEHADVFVLQILENVLAAEGHELEAGAAVERAGKRRVERERVDTAAAATAAAAAAAAATIVSGGCPPVDRHDPTHLTSARPRQCHRRTPDRSRAASHALERDVQTISRDRDRGSGDVLTVPIVAIERHDLAVVAPGVGHLVRVKVGVLLHRTAVGIEVAALARQTRTIACVVLEDKLKEDKHASFRQLSYSEMRSVWGLFC